MEIKEKQYLKDRIEHRRKQIKLIEDSLIKCFKDDIKFCNDILMNIQRLDIKEFEKYTLRINKYIKGFLKGGLK